MTQQSAQMQRKVIVSLQSQIVGIDNGLSYIYISKSTIVGLAVLNFVLGNIDEGFSCLEKAYESHILGLASINTYVLPDPVRSDPRFIDLLKKMELED